MIVFKFKTWFYVWHLVATWCVSLGLVGGIVWTAADENYDFLYLFVMLFLLLPLPLTYLFRSKDTTKELQ